MSAFVGRDAADIIGMLLHEVGVQVVERPAHLVGVLLIHAEDDGLGEAVGLLEELGQVPWRWPRCGPAARRSRSKSGVWYSSSGISRP